MRASKSRYKRKTRATPKLSRLIRSLLLPFLSFSRFVIARLFFLFLCLIPLVLLFESETGGVCRVESCNDDRIWSGVIVVNIIVKCSFLFLFAYHRSNSMGHGLTKDKLGKKCFIRFPYETRKFVSLAIIKSRWITRSTWFLEKDRRRDSCSPLCAPSLSPCVTRPNRILIGPMLTMFVDILYLTHHLARKLFYKQIIATAGSPPP